jgi:hypothetical protein
MVADVSSLAKRRWVLLLCCTFWIGLCAGKKPPFLRCHFILKINILPRQARDKQRESAQKRMAFSDRYNAKMDAHFPPGTHPFGTVLRINCRIIAQFPIEITLSRGDLQSCPRKQ